MSRYDPKLIEPKWQAAWDAAGAFTARRDPAKPKYYVLEMFPYPSGRIHMGHVRNYTMGDVVARYKASCGFSVSCTRWAGMPSGCPPKMRRWSAAGTRRTGPIPTSPTCARRCCPWGCPSTGPANLRPATRSITASNRAMFIDMMAAGLVYRKAAVVNWDPVDMTVLANEQVIDGKGWRSNAPVERRELTQWFFKISDYSGELLAALDGLKDWPEKVRLMQANWIGQSRGLAVCVHHHRRTRWV